MKRSLWFVVAVAAACGAPVAPAGGDDVDLPLGDRLADDLKADGNWGAALTCKPAPDLPSLVKPRIIVSIDGQTVHLIDDATGYDKVFPAGVGAIESDEASRNFGESHTHEPLLARASGDFAIRAVDIQPCKSWWTDPDTGVKSPVFAGLPFMPWYGGYALHGPIDNFRAPSGGNLRRGYVSHGCVRMEAADVLELYARIRRVTSTPVHVQREPERDAAGARVDIATRWIGSECASDADCNFAGGLCKRNAFSERGYCTARCTTTCADRAGYPVTSCVADPDDATVGMCVNRVSAQNFECRPLDHFVSRAAKRFRTTTPLTVCLPGTRGWIGDRCLADGDCMAGNTCESGLCTQACTRYCPDVPGAPMTTCAQDATLGTTCMRRCTLATNASECPAETRCVSHARPGQAAAYVCTPE
jgi:L,D-transpeptidase catalytic domain